MNGLGRETLAAEYARRRTPELRDAAVEAYLPAARSVARKFTGRGVDEDDMFQVASLAMVKALERFDTGRGIQFASFVTPAMVGEVKNYFRDRSRAIRPPRRAMELARLVDATREKLIQRLGLKNTWWALWLPWASGGQIMGMYLCRTFISSQPPALFESARIDGAREFQAFYKIAVPLAKPILATLVVMNMISLYGDFIWPLLVIDSNSKQVISVAVQIYSSSTGITDYGAMIAGFVMATIPLLIMFMFSSRLYIEGITSGAVKA